MGVFGDLAMDLLLLVKLVHGVFNRATGVFRDVLHVLDLVFEGLGVCLWVGRAKHAEVGVVLFGGSGQSLQPWR